MNPAELDAKKMSCTHATLRSDLCIKRKNILQVSEMITYYDVVVHI